MINLNELRKITDNKQSKVEDLLSTLSSDAKERYEQFYLKTINNLEKKLKKAAIDGKSELTVFKVNTHTKVETIPNFTKNLDSFATGNFLCAWRDKKMTAQNVFDNSCGMFRRIYMYLASQNLDPKIQHWTDGGGMEEGFKIYIKW